MAYPPLPTPLSRDDLFAFFLAFLDAHLACKTPDGLGLSFGKTVAHYDEAAIRLESFSRLLWGASAALQGGYDFPQKKELWVLLFEGCNPKHPAFFGWPSDCDQRFVEMAAISDFLLSTPLSEWQVFPKVAKDQVCQWLATILHAKIHPNNWVFFRVFVALALRHLGHPISEDKLNEDLDFIEAQYVGEGWYQDNQDACFDYYNAFAFHDAALRYAALLGETGSPSEKARAARFVARAQLFASTFQHWMSPNGGQLVYGRSLTYRAATLGVWGALAQVPPPHLPVAKMRGFWERGLRHFLSLPIFDERGVITLGYHYPNLLISELYNSPASPLWMSKVFFPLALPKDHAFWTGVCLPASKPPYRHFVCPLPFQMYQQKAGEVYLIPASPKEKPELRGCVDKYLKFAYSSAHGFSVEGTQLIRSGFIGDNLLAFSSDARHWFTRERIMDAYFEGDTLITHWSPCEGCQVTSSQTFLTEGESRVHEISSERPLFVIASGHAVDAHRLACPLSELGRQKVFSAQAVGKTLISTLTDECQTLAADLMPSAPNTHLLFPHACVPVLMGHIAAGTQTIACLLTYGKHHDIS